MPGSSPGMRCAGPESILPVVVMDSGLASSTRPGMTASDSHPALQRVADFVEHLGILYCSGHRPWVAVGDLLDGAAQDFPRTRFRQSAHRDRELERRHGAELFAHQRHDLFFDLGMAA